MESEPSYEFFENDILNTKWQLLENDGKRSIGVVAGYNPLDKPPDWLDKQRFIKGQKLAKKYFLSLNIAHFIGNILLVLLPDVLVPIAATGTSSSPYDILLRVLSTVVHVNSWYEGDPFDPTSAIHRSLKQVRTGCHLQVTRLLNSKYPNEKKENLLLDKNNLWLSQYDMAMTQWSLIGIIAIQPDQCSFYVKNKLQEVVNKALLKQKNSSKNKIELQDALLPLSESEWASICSCKRHAKRLYALQEFMYVWRVLGYCMGVRDEFNVCGEECFARNVSFLRICFERGYRPILTQPCALVQTGLSLVQGLFSAFACLMPSWLITYEGFMRYWFEALHLPHSFYIKKLHQRISYGLIVLLLDYLLRIRLLYCIWSAIFFRLLHRLLLRVRQSEVFIRGKLGHIQYIVNDHNGNAFSISNHLYRSNV